MKHVSLSVWNYAGKKICDLYDSFSKARGQAYDIDYAIELADGWQELTFSLPYMVGDEQNFRWNHIKAEMLLRLVEGDFTEWFIIRQPSLSKDDGVGAKVKAEHISTVLKTKGIYKTFDDTNGIGTMEYLMTQALDGTGWKLGAFDPIYESDGTSLKVRSITSDGQQGVLEIIGTICKLFKCYPIFHGDTHRVEIRALKHKEPQWEAEIGRNLSAITVNNDSTNIVTRLYVEGQYTDDGYIGIDDVNPTGMNFIFNFDYYKSIGMFTDDHQAIVDNYIAAMQNDKRSIAQISAQSTELLTKAQQLWGFPTYVIWKVYQTTSGGYAISNDSETYIDRSGQEQIGRYVSDTTVFTESQRKLLENDEVYVLRVSGSTYSHRIITMDSTPSVADLGLTSADTYVVKFKRDAPTGGWGVKESSYNAQQGLIDQANAVLTRQWKTQEEIDDANKTIAEATPKRDAVLRGEVYAMGRDSAGGTLVKMLTLTQKQNGNTAADLTLRGRSAAQVVSIQLEQKGYPQSYFDNKYDYQTSAGATGKIKFTNNEFRITIPANGYVVFKKLPLGVTFTATYIKQDGSNWVKVASLSATVDGFGGLDEVMYNAAAIGWSYQTMMRQVVVYQEDMAHQEDVLATGLGELLKDGRWNDENYIPGQEESLYADALDISKEMAYPTVTYDVSLVRIAEGFGIPTDMVKLNSALRVYDPDIPINDIVYVTKITRSLDHMDGGSVEISNSEVEASMVSLESVLGRMKELTDKLEARRTLYDRIAGVISDDGSVFVNRLNGEIDILRNRLSSAQSGWYTDDNGNIMFVDANETSAMMLTGQGFMIANGKTAAGDWNWRTFGTGQGFSADALITGYLSAERIEAGSINFTKFDHATQTQITTLENDVNSLELKVTPSEIAASLSTVNSSTGKTYASAMNVTSGSATLSFETIGNHAEKGNNFVSNQGTYFTADSTGLSIKKSGSNIHLLVTNNMIGFYKGAHNANDLTTNRVAYLSSDKLYVTNGDFTGNLHVGTGMILFGDNTARTSYYSNALVMEYTSASAGSTYTAYGKVAVAKTYSGLEFQVTSSQLNAFYITSDQAYLNIGGATRLQVTNTTMAISDNTSITGTLSCSSTLTSDGKLTVTSGGASITGATTIAGNTSITGTLSSTSTLTSGGKLTVSSGGAAITGATSIAGNTSVTGTLSSTSTLTSGGKLTVSSGGAAITGGTSITGDTSITGALSTTKTATVNKLVVGKTTAPTGVVDINGRVDIYQASENGYSLVVKNYSGYNNLVIGGDDGMVLRGDVDPIKMYGDIYLHNSGTTRVVFHVGSNEDTSTVCYRFTESSGLQRSTNGGDTWTTIAG